MRSFFAPSSVKGLLVRSRDVRPPDPGIRDELGTEGLWHSAQMEVLISGPWVNSRTAARPNSLYQRQRFQVGTRQIQEVGTMPAFKFLFRKTSQKPIDSGFGAASTASDVVEGLNLSGKVAIVTGG